MGLLIGGCVAAVLALPLLRAMLALALWVGVTGALDRLLATLD